jgi:Porin subfamily
MRKLLLIMIVPALPSFAEAEQLRLQKTDKVTASDKPLPLKRSNNACAEYGAGFVKIEGTNTCMKIGGAISIGAGVSSGAR